MAIYEENYRDFKIEVLLEEMSTTWNFEVRIGKMVGENFILEPAIPRETKNTDRTHGAINVALTLIAEAKAKIDSLLKAT